MIQVDNSDIAEQHSAFLKAYLSGSSAPFLGKDYMSQAFPKLETRAYAERLKMMKKKDPSITSPFPYQVKIPKSIRELKDGDLSPAKVLTINEPIKGPYSNMWFGNTLEGISFRWGYVNGDSRKISSDSLDDSTVHGFLAGATGQGKSVTLNAAIYGCCVEYPPWELTLTLSDAKIVEFKTIATSHPMPQIDIVAATADTDYLLSMLNAKHKEMIDRQSAFTAAGKVLGVGIKNIKEFRKETGLCMPRVLLVFDECTAMFQNAGKRATQIAEIIDSIARLGRNAGFHLLLTSQEVSSDIPAKTLANLTLRGAMGCTGPISEKVIGNDGAVQNMGKKGRLIVNTEASSKESKDHNVLIRVPFTPENQINVIADKVIEMGKATGTANVLRFYDEEARLYPKAYRNFVHSLPYRPDRIILGPPSFIMDGPEQAVTMKMTGDNIENICCFVNSDRNKLRMLEMLKINLCGHPENSHCVLCVDPMFKREGKLEEIAAGKMFFEERNFETSSFFKVARSTIYRRMLCVKTDELAFSDGTTKDNIDNIFYRSFECGSEYDTVINRCRYKYYIEFLNRDVEIRKGFQIENLSGDAASQRVMKLAAECIRLCNFAGCSDTPMVREKCANAYYWIFGLERFIGLGRDYKSLYVNQFKKLLQDGTSYNARFIVFNTTFEDLGSIVGDFGYYLLEDLSSKQASNIKVQDDYPEKLADGLMLLFQPQIQKEGRVQKFKKLMFEEEM